MGNWFFAHQTSQEIELTQTNVKHMGFRNKSTTLLGGIFHREITKYELLSSGIKQVSDKPLRTKDP